MLFATDKGSSAIAEQHILIARWWLDLPKLDVSAVIRRVEPKANVAGGPTRNKFDIWESFGAVQVPASLPSWVQCIRSLDDLAWQLAAREEGS